MNYMSQNERDLNAKIEALEARIAKLEPQTGVPAGFVRWDGGECPVPLRSTVEIITESGNQWRNGKAGDWDWHNKGVGAIVAYRVVKPMTFTLNGETLPLPDTVLTINDHTLQNYNFTRIGYNFYCWKSRADRDAVEQALIKLLGGLYDR